MLAGTAAKLLKFFVLSYFYDKIDVFVLHNRLGMINRWIKLLVIISFINYGVESFATPNLEGIQTYQKNIHLSETRKQLLKDDIHRYRNADNMWDLLRSEFTLPHYEDTPAVREQISWFLNNQQFLSRAAERAAPYLYYISQQVRKRHLPAEMVLLPMIESAYNPFVYSSVGAGGIWQMMPGTATDYGIKQSWWYDGRRDVIASTKAALDYLVYLGNFFDGNWLLAIAAYNTGAGNVLSAIRKNVRDGRNTDFWSLPVHSQTKEYVPRLLALAAIISNPSQYFIDLPIVSNAPYLAEIDMGGQIDLKYAAYLAGLSLKELKQLNPGYNHVTTDPSGPFKLILPIENVAKFSENLMRAPSSPHEERIHWDHYKVRVGDTLLAIARRFNTTPTTLKNMNSLTTAQLKPGTKLIVPKEMPDITKTIIDSEKQLKLAKKSTVPSITPGKSPYQLKPGDTLYMARKGDTFNSISTKFHLDTKTLLAANNLDRPQAISVGAKLIIPTHTITTQKYKLSPNDTIYMVRLGDTLEKIAQKFHTTAPAIRIANLLANNKIHAGDQLVIPKSSKT